MRSKTWAIALAILSRLTIADCVGRPLHRPYQAAAAAGAEERVRDAEGEIDDVYRLREELSRENLLKHLKLPVKNGISASDDVEYADEDAESKQRYHGNRQNLRSRPTTDEKGPEMTINQRNNASPMKSMHAGRNGPGHGSHRDLEHSALRGQLGSASEAEIEETAFPKVERKAERTGSGVIRTAPYVHIRSGIESFQPIAAAIAMQENLNALEHPLVHSAPPPPPPPPPPPKLLGPASDKNAQEDESQSEPLLSNVKVNHPTDAGPRDYNLPRHGQEEAPMEVHAALQQSQIRANPDSDSSLTEVYFLAVVAGCSVAGFVGLVLAGVCYYRLRKRVKATSDVEYPAYGVTGPIKERDNAAPGDRKLAQSAQMYHYQHQRQQMIASERLNSDVNNRGSDAESEDENEEGDYTVFECPGLATNGDMEVRNPLFSEQTPVTAPSDIPATQGRK